jgi:hypothetical protein
MQNTTEPVIFLSVDMNHAVQKGPEEDVGEHLAEKSVGEQLLSAPEELVPVKAGFPQQHQPQR